MISNIWNHPKTTAAGLLIAVVTIAGVFAQQGVTLGNLGTGTVVTLITAVATALLGLLARDPGNAASVTSSSTAKLSVWMLIALLIPIPWMQGCTAATAAQDIVNWTPALQAAVATVDSTASLLAPMDAPIFTAATVGFDAASNLMVAQAKAYLANPTASILVQLQTQIVTLQQQVNASLLQMTGIKDAASQTQALNSVQAVATIVTAILALVTSISTKAQVAQMALDSTIKLAKVEPYVQLDRSARIVKSHDGSGYVAALVAVNTGMTHLQAQGF